MMRRAPPDRVVYSSAAGKHVFIMKIPITSLMLAFGILALSGTHVSAAGPERDRPFDSGWRFHRGDAAGAEAPVFDDASWRSLDLPHDWSIEDAPVPEDRGPELVLSPESWKFAPGDDLAWAGADFDDRGWREAGGTNITFNALGHTAAESMGWYRCRVAVPDALRGKDFVLRIGVIDDADETFFNGVKIGGIGGMPPHFDGSGSPWTRQRAYTVPAKLVRDGANVVAIRVFNNSGDGGLTARPPDFREVGPFSPESPGGFATGHTLGGTGWYRKRFTLDQADAGKTASIRFDGVYMDSDVWLNGRHLGNHPYGYTAFNYDLTPHLNPPGVENVLSVRVRNLGKNSRWYSGSGIYRHVTLTVADPTHVVPWGVSITTPEVSDRSATVKVAVSLANKRQAAANGKLRVRITGPAGDAAGTAEKALALPASGNAQLSMDVAVKSPELWSPESPRLYQAEVVVETDGRIVDRTVTGFGIRTIRFSADKGFELNGEPVELRGACLHHDNGPLGAAAIDRAEERRVELMKSLGYNAIRCSHNPPSAVFLDACDRLGMLVMNEAFDCWEKGKNPDDYGKYFNDWWRRDLAAMILRDRNHPSVILWSIGNEIPQRADERGYEIAKDLADEVRRLDPTRPVTEGVCNFWDQPGRKWEETEKAFSFLDVGGYNYEPAQYEPDHAKFPARVMVGTESYPAEIDLYWELVEKHPYVIGDFVWTGMDYLGEAGCGHMRFDNEPDGFGRPWPWFNAFCGDLDICGFRKPQSFYRDIVWKRSPLEIMVHRPLPPGRTEQTSRWGWPDELPSWTWPGHEGKPLRVTVYSRCESVRLELNGREIATRRIAPADRFRATFELPWQPGELRAVGLDGGKTAVASRVLRSAGPAAGIRLSADRASIRADRNDLAYIAAEIIDSAGNPLPDAEVALRFTAGGAGEIAALGSGSPNRPEGFRGPTRTTWRGRALAILRPNGPAGNITLRAEADGLEPAEVVVSTRD
jgi:beta-galactosidase